MAMEFDVESRKDGRSHIVLGPVEKAAVMWFVGLSGSLAVLLLALAGWWAKGVSETLSDQGSKMNTVLVQQAVQAAQYANAGANSANLAALNDRVTKIETIQQTILERQKELDRMRGIK